MHCMKAHKGLHSEFFWNICPFCPSLANFKDRVGSLDDTNADTFVNTRTRWGHILGKLKDVGEM